MEISHVLSPLLNKIIDRRRTQRVESTTVERKNQDMAHRPSASTACFTR